MVRWLRLIVWAMAGMAGMSCVGLGWRAVSRLRAEPDLRPRGVMVRKAGVVRTRARDEDEEIVRRRNVFCAGCGEVTVAREEGERGLVLVATAIGKKGMVFAAIANTRNQQLGAYGIDEVIPGVGAIVDIRQAWVEYRSDESGKVKRIHLAGGGGVGESVGGGVGESVRGGVRRIGSGSYEIERGLVASALADPWQVARGMRVRPMAGGGIAVYGVKANGLFAEMGIENGDVLRAVNGVEISSADQAMAVYGQLKSASSLSLDLLRRGKAMRLEYSIR